MAVSYMEGEAENSLSRGYTYSLVSGTTNKDSFRENGTIKYKNYNNVYCGFSYAPWQVQDYLYPYIAKEYCALKFVCIHDKSDFQKEQEYAREKEAFFWRNGRPYGTKNRN